MRLGWHWRVGAEFGKRFQTSYVTIIGEDGRIHMSPSDAREMSRLLKRAADAVDPPKKRRTR